MANRVDRLNALATGGTAGLAAFDRAQSAVAANNSNALDSALNYGGHTQNYGAKTADAIGGLVSKYTQGYTNDAASARANAGDQVNYDASALDSFIANNQKQLDAQRSQANQKNELSSLQNAADLASQQRKTDYYNQKNSAGGQIDPTSTAGKAVIEAQGQQLQQQALTEAQNNVAAGTGPYALLAARATHDAAGRAGVDVTDPNAKLPAGNQAAQFYQQGQQPQGPTINVGQQLAAQQVAMDRAKESAGLLPLIQLNRAGYNQQAAINAGVNPDLAAGLWESSPDTLRTAQDKEIDRRQAEDDNLSKATQKAIDDSGLSYSRIKSAASAAGTSVDAAAPVLQSDKFSKVQALFQDAYTSGEPRENQIAQFSQNVDAADDLTAQEKVLLKSYFLSGFGTTPTDSQYATAGTGVYG